MLAGPIPLAGLLLLLWPCLNAAPARAQMWLPASAPAAATVTIAPAEEGIQTAVVVNPLGPLLGLTVDLAGIDSALLHIKVHRALSKRWGMTVAPVYAHVNFMLDFHVLGVKGGPRISLTGPGLAGWSLLPQVLLGWAWTTNSHDKLLTSAPFAGAGLSTGYAWCWGGFVLELGGGLYSSTYLDVTELGAPEPLIGVKPEVNINLGYGW